MPDTFHWLPVRQRIIYPLYIYGFYNCLALYPWRCSCLSFGAFCPIFVLSGSNQELLSDHLSVSDRESYVLLYLLNSPVYLLIATLATSPLRFPILLYILLFCVST